jgi:outer membrane protein TolC
METVVGRSASRACAFGLAWVGLGLCLALILGSPGEARASEHLRPEWQVGQEQVSPEDLSVIVPAPAPPELSLQDAVLLALEQNLGFRRTLQGLLAAQSNWYVARQRWSLSALAAAERTGNDETVDQVTAGAAFSYAAVTGADFSVVAELARLDSEETQDSVSVVLRQPLLAGRGDASAAYEEVRRARDAYRAELLLFFTDRQSLIEQIVGAYFDVVEQLQLVAIQEASVERRKQSVEDARLRLEAGLIPEIELRRAQLRLSTEEGLAVLQKQRLRDTTDRLLLLLGLEVGGMPELVTPVPYDPQSLDVAALTAQALESRPDLLLADIAIEDAEAALRISRSERLPSLDLFGGWWEQRNGIEERSWNVGLDLSIPIGSRSLTEAVNQARWDLLVSQQGRETLVQQVVADVRTEARAAEAARANIDIAESSVELAERSIEIAQRMVEEGLGTNRDLLDAQDDLRQSQRSLVNSQISYYLALVRLRVALGLDLLPVVSSDQAPTTSPDAGEPDPEAAG